jgi:gentisate 1,2-dioxygenase
MRPYDLVLTPSWQWHDHGNDTSRPMIWLDGLDIPTVRHFAASFAEKTEDPVQARLVPDDDSLSRYGRNLRPLRAASPIGGRLTVRYSITLTPNGAAVSPISPSARPIRISAMRSSSSIPPTAERSSRRSPPRSSSCRQACDAPAPIERRRDPCRCRGSGIARIADREVALAPRDIFVVPSWTLLELQAGSDLVLFSYSDRAAQARSNSIGKTVCDHRIRTRSPHLCTDQRWSSVPGAPRFLRRAQLCRTCPRDGPRSRP